jgi:SPP1 gp7 family putative phage head morphogenesis protein
VGRKRQEKALEDALARALTVGVEAGRQRGLFAVLMRVVRSLLRRDVQDAVRMVEQDGPERTLRGLSRLVQDVWRSRWSDVLSPLLEAIMGEATLPTDRGPIRLGFDLTNPLTAEFFESYKIRLSEQVTETTREKLEAAIREGIEEGLSVPEVARKVSEVGEEFEGYRADLIARDQLHKAAIESSEMQAKRSGVVNTQTWRGTLDSRERPEHVALEGVTVGIDEEFPGGIHPKSEIACRCFIVYGINLDAVRGEVA